MFRYTPADTTVTYTNVTEIYPYFYATVKYPDGTIVYEDVLSDGTRSSGVYSVVESDDDSDSTTLCTDESPQHTCRIICPWNGYDTTVASSCMISGDTYGFTTTIGNYYNPMGKPYSVTNIKIVKNEDDSVLNDNLEYIYENTDVSDVPVGSYYVKDGLLKKKTAVAPYIKTYIESLNKYKPFDDKAYTCAVMDGDVKYRVTGDYEIILIENIVADTVEVITPNNTYTYEQHNGRVAVREHGSGEVTINIYGDHCEVGGIYFGVDGDDLGITSYDFEFSLTDYSPYEVKLGGYVDYIPGIALWRCDISSVDEKSRLSDMLNIIKDGKRKRLIYDMTEGDDTFEYVISARIADASVRSIANEDGIAAISSSFTIEEGA